MNKKVQKFIERAKRIGGCKISAEKTCDKSIDDIIDNVNIRIGDVNISWEDIKWEVRG